ncbi:MAG: dTMP kinase, partial [Pseudomonadota bacterium]
MKFGKFIVFEGGEGVGKTTQIQLLKKQLEDKSIPYLITREPGGTPLAEALRTLFLQGCDGEIPLPVSELLMVFAARLQHWTTKIKPSLAQGKIVICDRYMDASYAYQGEARGLGFQAIDSLREWMKNNGAELGMPDKIILLDSEVYLGQQRIQTRKNLDRFDQEADVFFNKIR